MVTILVSLETTLDSLFVFYKKNAKSPEDFWSLDVVSEGTGDRAVSMDMPYIR